MSIAIDIVLVVIFLGILIFFTKYGLDRALYKLGKAWLAVACAFFIGPLITSLLEDLFITKVVTDAVYSSLTQLITHNANGYNLSELFASMPDGFVKFLDGLGASLSALEAEFGSYTEATDTIIFAMATRIATPCVSGISSLLGHIIGFVVPWLFMKWIAYQLNKDERHMFFRVCDYIGGFLVGVVVGYAAVMGLSILTSTIFQVIIAFDRTIPVMEIYEASFVFKFLAEFDAVGKVSSIFHSFSNLAVSLFN